MTPLLLSLVVAASGVIAPSEVHPHQRGICVTEWNNGERIEIPVEVVGVMDAPGPLRTAVLIRLDDARFQGQGVAAGMSGSPVYIDGRLLGALAFGWNFASEPLAGVTPFSIMQEIRPGVPEGAPAAPTLKEMAAVAAGSISPLDVLPRLPAASGAELRPIAVGGLPAASDFGAEILSRAGLQQVPAGGVDDSSGVPAPGEMVAALLTWGDAILAAAGTVTARENDRIYAFGHPLFDLGGIAIPAARAHTLAVQSSYMNPFKIFTVGEPFGTFVADRTPGIMATIGEVPPGIPFAVTVREGTSEHVWRFHMADIPALAPLLATFLANSSLSALGAAVGDATVGLELEADLADGRSVTVRQELAGPDAVARAASFAGAFLGFLQGSSFPHPDVTGLRAEIVRSERLHAAAVIEAIPERRQVRPGDELVVDVRLQPHLAPASTQRLRIPIPADQPPGRLDLVVGDGAAWTAYRIKAEGVQPASFADQIAEVQRLEPSSTLVLALESFAPGLAIPGASQPALPPSWAATIATGLGRDAVNRLKTAIVVTARWHAPYPLSGAFRVPLTVLPSQEVR